MAFRVLIIEDKPAVGSLISQHLADPFRQEIQHGWDEEWIQHAEDHLEVRVMTEKAVEELVAIEDEAAVKKVIDRKQPNLILTDLALSDQEVKDLENRGGTEISGRKDPTKQLAVTTGFQILKAMAPTVPVIATTYASNPRVKEACWEAGAHAVIAKPANDEQMSICYLHWQHRDSNELTRSQKEKARRWKPRIEAYLRAVSQEILKAIQGRALTEMYSVVPRQLPYWLGLDHDRLDGRLIEGTSLTMMEVLGFLELAEMGVARPDALFKLVNEIWNEIQLILDSSEAEVNHFAGHVGVICHGVYDEPEGERNLDDTLRCAAVVSALFERDLGPLRVRLSHAICDLYDGDTRRKMLSHIESRDFDARIISIQPQEDHALYGKVGASSRWQHTTLSQNFDLLQAARAELGRVERSLSRTPGDSFLLFDKRGKPEFNGFHFEPLNGALEEGQQLFQRELVSWSIYRVLTSDRAYA